MGKPNITFETEKLIVRPVAPGDKEKYMKLRRESSPIKGAYDVLDGLLEEEWKAELNSAKDIFLVASMKDSGVFAASASYQHFEDDEVEIGIDVAEEHRNKGIATELLTNMLRIAHDKYPDKRIILRTERTNAACRKAAEKCGGTICGYEPHPFSRLMDVFFKVADERFPGSRKMDELKQEYIAALMGNMDELCVYQF